MLRHGANPLQQNSKGKAAIDVAADDVILKLLKSETLANSSSGDSITSEVGHVSHEVGHVSHAFWLLSRPSNGMEGYGYEFVRRVLFRVNVGA